MECVYVRKTKKKKKKTKNGRLPRAGIVIPELEETIAKIENEREEVIKMKCTQEVRRRRRV